MTYSFSRREKVLLVVLLLAVLTGVYMMVVHVPITDRMNELEAEEQDTRLMIDLAEARLARYHRMQDELNAILAQPEDKLTVMPEYDNIRPLMDRLNAIFLGMEPRLNFGEPAVENGVAARTIDFACTAPSYARAREVLEELTGTGWRCLMDEVTIRPDEDGDLDGGPLTVTGTITFYELVENAPAEE